MCVSFSWLKSPGGSAGRAVDSVEKLNLVSDLALNIGKELHLRIG
jgi:hypothetical protein